MASYLDSVPSEIHDIFLQELEPRDLLAVRAVNRRLNMRTIPRYGTILFAIVRTDFSKRSMRRIKRISETPALMNYVRELHVQPHPRRPTEYLTGVEHLFASDDSAQQQQPRAEFAANVVCKSPGWNLHNCRTFRVDGQTPLLQQTRFTPSHAIATVVSVITLARLPVDSFIVDCQSTISTQTMNGAALVDYSNGLRGFRDAWAYLQELSLSLPASPSLTNGAVELITHAVRLKKLSLEIDNPLFHNRLYYNLFRLDDLQELRLSRSNFATGVLPNLLREFTDKIRVLSFGPRVGLASGDWASVFRLLKDRFTKLQNVAVRNVLGRGINGQTTGVWFPAFNVQHDGRRDCSVQPLQHLVTLTREAGRTIAVEYQGPDIARLVDILGQYRV